MNKLFLSSICTMFFVTGCASIKPLEPPATSGDPKFSLSRRVPNDNERFPGKSVPSSYFSVSGKYRGAEGSIVAGSLLGPLGVIVAAAGAKAYVDSQNTKKAGTVTDITSINLADVLRSADGDLQVSTSTGTSDYALTPLGVIFFEDDQRFYLSCALVAESVGNKSAPWKARYEVNPDNVFSTGTTLQKDLVSKTLTGCLTRAKSMFVDHVTGRTGNSTARTVTINGTGSIAGSVSLKIPVYEKYLPNRIIANDGRGLTEFRRSTTVVN